MPQPDQPLQEVRMKEPRLFRANEALGQIECRKAGGLATEALDELARNLEGVGGDAVAAWLAQREPTAASVYLATRLVPLGDPGKAAERWEALLSLSPMPDPALLLPAAKSALAAGTADRASVHLRAALALRPPYVFHARAAALVKELWRGCPPASRTARIAILGASTTALLVPVVRALCFRDGVNAEFYEGVYGAYRQEILDPLSGLHRFRPTIAFIAPHWRAVAIPPVSEDEDRAVETIVAEHEALWNALSQASACHVVQHAFDLPAEESHDHVATRPGGRTRIIERVNLEFQRRAPSFVSILDQAAVQREVGRAAWQNERLWFVARQHPAPEALPALAEMQMAHVRAVTGLTKKVVVCDLDNTLWG
ncbi:MAG: hypothetical protein EHM13_15715, partial [Acidobacteria bacterium]